MKIFVKFIEWCRGRKINRLKKKVMGDQVQGK
jgi:hypothetical protein